ncbi:MAG: hypothetical protein U1E91_05300 [Moraxella sp.]
MTQQPAKEEAELASILVSAGFVNKIVIVLAVILIAILLGAYYAVGTPWGTRLLINAIVQETGISLTYGKGNLRDGIWVYDLKIPDNAKNMLKSPLIKPMSKLAGAPSSINKYICVKPTSIAWSSPTKNPLPINPLITHASHCLLT